MTAASGLARCIFPFAYKDLTPLILPSALQSTLQAQVLLS